MQNTLDNNYSKSLWKQFVWAIRQWHACGSEVKNKAMTYDSLHKFVQLPKGKQNAIKVDRSILQRLITAYRAGRKVNLENILQHELPIPLYLTTTNGCLSSTHKTMMVNILTKQVQTPADYPG